MKIFYNFDTSLRRNIYKESCAKFGREHVLILRRCYMFFVFKILFPFFFLMLMAGITIRGVSYVLIDYFSYTDYLLYIDIVILLFWLSVLGLPILRNYIDYTMDFLVITPEYISAYNQTGIFSRGNRTIDSTSLESITIPKTTFIMSVFNYSTIIFLSGVSDEGNINDDAKGHIKFYFVHNPEKTKQKIMTILQKDTKVLN